MKTSTKNLVKKVTPNRGLRFVLVLLFVFALAQFLVFTYRLPWYDIFAIPPGWE